MPIRISQERVEILRQGTARNLRVTQEAIEQAFAPAGQQNLRITQIAIEFPFPGPTAVMPPTVPIPTQGDTPPIACAPPPTMLCTTEPDVQATTEACELQGS